MKSLSLSITNKDATIGIVGLGYVGLPLAIQFLNNGFNVIGYDVDSAKVKLLEKGESYISHIESSQIMGFVSKDKFKATSDESMINKMDCILICVPTPIDEHRVPDLSSVLNTTRTISKNMSPNTLICLESSTYPQTTSEELKPILDQSGFVVGKDYFLCYSPEREDPGNKKYNLNQIPKVLGSDDSESLKHGKLLYESIINSVHIVNSTATAEAVKLTENIFRAVNISLSNELKMIFKEMGIDVWDVIDAAATKPFGFMPFYPGPGVGGHCIPIDPFYLTYKAKEFGMPTRFIELAGEYNNIALDYTVNSIVMAINQFSKKSISESKILLLGLAYKKNIDDMRESPSMFVYERLLKLGANVFYNDEFIPVIPGTREHPKLEGLQSLTLDKKTISEFDACVVLTDHDYFDKNLIIDNSHLVLDTRNHFKDFNSSNLHKI